jgi:glycosyltransferase involved in cell wall biosynthesis
MKRYVVIISVNNTVKPKTGGEYVFKVIKSGLIERGYSVHEFSVPELLRKCCGGYSKLEKVLRLSVHGYCSIISVYKRYYNVELVITSASPVFPVFGNIVYHQPKASMNCPHTKAYVDLYIRFAFKVLENERMSPLWCLAKRSYALHLSNSFFTKRLIRELYGIESKVLYPPVCLPDFCGRDIKKHRRFSIVVVRPKSISGIAFLPNIISSSLKDVPILVIGDCDYLGLKIITDLKKRGFNIKYFGFVSDSFKRELFKKASHYLHLGLNESFGITVVEAMASGCIPIAPKSGAIPEYLPEPLLYSDFKEASEKLIAKVGINDIDLKTRLRGIAERFDESIFKAKFCRYVDVVREKEY